MNDQSPGDDGRANRFAARRHLDAMPPAKRADLNREWLAAEAAVDAFFAPIPPEIIALAHAEWNSL